MGLFSWLSSKSPSDTEVLEALAESIRARDERLSEIRRREVRTSLLFTLYSTAAWALYLALWFYSLLPALEGRQTPLNWTIPRSAEKIVHLAPGVAGPIIIYQTRRLVQSWYKRRQTLEENQLKKLRAEQKKKLEEIKTKHNFDKTKELLELYGESPRKDDSNSSVRQRAITMSPSTPRTSARSHNQKPQQFDPRASTLAQFTPTPPRPMQPPQRGWLDKVADKVLGEDDSTIGLAQSRYALICENCFSHNGLVKESDWITTQYICPKCGHLNLSPETKKAGVRTPPRLQVPVMPGFPGPLTAQSLLTPYSPLTVHSPFTTHSIHSLHTTHSHSPSPLRETPDPPSQDHPSQDQPLPEQKEEDASSS